MKKKGILLIFLSLVTTAVLFVMAKGNPPSFPKLFLAAAQISALFGMIFFCYAFLLSSRFSFLERIFGGMDKVYKLHQITGRFSFMLIIAHFIFLIINYINSSTMLNLLLLPGKTLSYNLGIFSLWSMCLVLSIILYLALDYQWFIRAQDLFIVPFSLGVLHTVLVPSDASMYLPLTIFLLLHISVAYISFIYRVFLYRLMGPRFKYRVDSLQIYPNDVIILSLAPESKKMPFLPGQFTYVRFESLGVKKEFHPFSIASSPFDEKIRLAIKASGDFTTQLKTLKIGETAIMTGPYGRFCARFFGKEDAVCIAGGIGITPFLGIINYLKDSNLHQVKNLHLFYSVKNPSDAIFNEELVKISNVRKNLFLKLIHTEQGIRLSAETIKSTIGELRDKLYFLCGPRLMMEDLAKQLKKFNIPARNIIYEDFSFR